MTIFLRVSVLASKKFGPDFFFGIGIKKIWSQFFFGIGIKKFGLVKKVSVLVLENLVSLKKSRYRSRKIWSRIKSLGIGIGKIGLKKWVPVG